MQNNQITYERDNRLIYCYFRKHSADRKKLIGTINLTDRTFYKTIIPQKHTFNVSDSIGIAYELLKLNEYDLIQIHCGCYCFETTKNYFLEHSEFKRFLGFELQKLMNKDLFGMDKAESWEQEQTKRINDVPVITNPVKKVLQMELF